MGPVEFIFNNLGRNNKKGNGQLDVENIDIRFDNNVHVVAGKWDLRNLVISGLLSLIIIQTIISNWHWYRMYDELTETKSQVATLSNHLVQSNNFYENLENKVTAMEFTFAKHQESSDQLHKMYKRDAGDLMCNNSSRQTRSVSRGKLNHSKNRSDSRCRSKKKSGPFAIHLIGSMPEIIVRDGGIIGPWHVDLASSGTFILADGIQGESGGIVEIIHEGLYFIYAQMYYLTSSSLNSYAINVQEGRDRQREDMAIATCSAEAATHRMSELSCFTAVVRYLKQGDRIFATQRERERQIIFRDNKSFLGLTLLNYSHK